VIDETLRRDIARALEEDLGGGDLTSRLTIEAGSESTARIVAKADLVVAGLPVLAEVFRQAGPGVAVDPAAADGEAVKAGSLVARLHGPTRTLLAGERVALNHLQFMSGVATLTRRFVEAVAGLDVRILSTRKTLPGLRRLSLYAVRAGGGRNHRGGLHDGILIKENHIAAAGGVAAAVRRAREGAPHLMRVEVEVESLEELDAAVEAGADVVLLDNMDLQTLRRAVDRAAGRVLLEASGGISLENVRAVAETGVPLISVGALTHSAPAADLSMLFG